MIILFDISKKGSYFNRYSMFYDNLQIECNWAGHCVTSFPLYHSIKII